MGRKLDALLGRKFKTRKFKATVNLAMSRLAILKNQRRAHLTVARSDIIQLLNLNYHEHALLRVDQVIKEQNMLDVLVMVDGYCHLLLQMVKLIEKERYCPDDLKEPVSSLIFAAPRCGEFPELQEIRAILTARYGKEFKFANGDIELRNSCGVNTIMVQKLSSRRSSLEARMKMLQEIAIENDIVLKLDDLPPVLKEGDSESTNGDTARNSSALDFDDVLSFTESVKGRIKYKGVEDAAQAAFESAAYAATAARAVVEFSQSRSTGSDKPDSSNSGTRKLLDSNLDHSNLQTKFEETRKTESENESESEPEPEPDNEIENETTDTSSSSKLTEFDIENSELLFGERLKTNQTDLRKKHISMRSI